MGIKNQGEKQESIMKSISKDLWKSANQFDIDSSSNAKYSFFDTMVKEKQLQKTLESDDLVIVEGNKAKYIEYTKVETIEEDIVDKLKEETMSCGDFHEEYDEKFDLIEEREMPELTRFEKSPYFGRLFPSLKI